MSLTRACYCPMQVRHPTSTRNFSLTSEENVIRVDLRAATLLRLCHRLLVAPHFFSHNSVEHTSFRKLIVAKMSYKFLTFVAMNLMILFVVFCTGTMKVHTFHCLKIYLKILGVPAGPFPSVLGIKIWV
jgi:hypothetical protein